MSVMVILEYFLVCYFLKKINTSRKVCGSQRGTTYLINLSCPRFCFQTLFKTEDRNAKNKGMARGKQRPSGKKEVADLQNVDPSGTGITETLFNYKNQNT